MALNDAQNDEIKTMMETLDSKIESLNIEKNQYQKLLDNFDEIYQKSKRMGKNSDDTFILQKLDVMDSQTGDKMDETRRTLLFNTLRAKFLALQL